MNISAKKNIALTIYTLLIGLLSAALNHLSAGPGATTAADLINLDPNQTSVSMVFAAMTVVWLLLTGIALLAIYWFALDHQPRLNPPTGQFRNYYQALIAWLAIFFTVELIVKNLALAFRPNYSTGLMIVISLILTTMLDAAAIAIMFRRFRAPLDSFKKWLADLINPKKMTVGRALLWGIGGYIAFIPIFGLGSLVNYVIMQIFGADKPVQPLVQLSMENDSLAITLILLFSVMVIAPFFEELIMRGLVFRGLLLKLSPPLAMILSGLIFSAFHFNIFALLPIWIIGTLLSWLYYRTGSLLPGMIAHALFNGVNFLLLVLIK